MIHELSGLLWCIIGLQLAIVGTRAVKHKIPVAKLLGRPLAAARARLRAAVRRGELPAAAEAAPEGGSPGTPEQPGIAEAPPPPMGPKPPSSLDRALEDLRQKPSRISELPRRRPPPTSIPSDGVPAPR